MPGRRPAPLMQSKAPTGAPTAWGLADVDGSGLPDPTFNQGERHPPHETTHRMSHKASALSCSGVQRHRHCTILSFTMR